MSNTQSTLALTLAEKDLERIITTTIQAQVAAAFSAKGGELAGRAIDRMLSEKVDEQGKPCSYGRTTMIEQLCTAQLRELVRTSIAGWIQENEDDLRKAVVAQLSQRGTKNAIANTLLHRDYRDGWTL